MRKAIIDVILGAGIGLSVSAIMFAVFFTVRYFLDTEFFKNSLATIKVRLNVIIILLALTFLAVALPQL